MIVALPQLTQPQTAECVQLSATLVSEQIKSPTSEHTISEERQLPPTAPSSWPALLFGVGLVVSAGWLGLIVWFAIKLVVGFFS